MTITRDPFDQDMRGLVRGYTWKAKMANGAVFEIWTSQDISRTEAREELFRIANIGGDAYGKDDLSGLWRTKG